MLAVAVAALAVLVGLSVAADRAFAGEARLPMQFGLTLTPGWSLPRRAALAFTPVLAAATLGLLMAFPDRAQGAAMLVVAGSFVAAHLLHLWLIARHLARR